MEALENWYDTSIMKENIFKADMTRFPRMVARKGTGASSTLCREARYDRLCLREHSC